jgi:superfamily II DNA/RNA helicase
MTFEELGLGPEVLRAVADAGYETPTPIQEQAIPYVLMGRDMLGCAQTGTGKTASFTLPMIDILARGRARARMPRSLIITPTRELATQIAENFEVYGKYHKLSMALLIGGVSFVEQNAKLDRGVDVLIATPGRLLDHFERGRILLTGIKILVIDEADRMMDMGFMPEVEKIVGLLPPLRQTLFFSATMPKEIRRLADKFLMNPKEISVSPKTATAETVEQSLIVVEDTDHVKRDVLRRLIRNEEVVNALIFCNRKRDVDSLAKSLKNHDFNVAALHGDMVQSIRTETLESFKVGNIQLLVASDVAARGLDLPKVSHVFNFDVPMNAEDYVHRIGRTGRAGREGRAMTIATSADGKFLSAVEAFIGNPIPRMEVDGIESVAIDDSKRGRRGRPAKPSANDRSRTKKPRTAKPAPQPSPVTQMEEKPVVQTDPETVVRPVEFAAEENSKPQSQPKPARSEGRQKKPPNRKSGNSEVGMGAHVPAFMQRATSGDKS